SFGCWVGAAGPVGATNGSWVRLYSSGSGPPPPNGLLRLVGMWVCSGTSSDSKRRASISRASSSGRMDRSVGKMQVPMCMADLLGRAGRGELLGAGEVVQTRAVVPEDLGLGLVADALETDELLDGHREEPIGVRVVRRDHDVVVADGLHDLAQRLLVGVGGHVALAEEVLARHPADL